MLVSFNLQEAQGQWREFIAARKLAGGEKEKERERECVCPAVVPLTKRLRINLQTDRSDLNLFSSHLHSDWRAQEKDEEEGRKEGKE